GAASEKSRLDHRTASPRAFFIAPSPPLRSPVAPGSSGTPSRFCGPDGFRSLPPSRRRGRAPHRSALEVAPLPVRVSRDTSAILWGQHVELVRAKAGLGPLLLEALNCSLCLNPFAQKFGAKARLQLRLAPLALSQGRRKRSERRLLRLEIVLAFDRFALLVIG